MVALPGGILTDALRRYWGWVMAVCMALFGVGWLLMAAAGWQLPGSAWLVSQETVATGGDTSLNVFGYALLLAGMAIVAIAASVWHLPAIAALSSHFTHRRASVLSFHGVGGNIGDVAGPVLTGLLLVSLTWQAIITIYAAVPLFLAFLVFWAFRDIGHRAQAAGGRPAHQHHADTNPGNQDSGAEPPDVGDYHSGRTAGNGLPGGLSASCRCSWPTNWGCPRRNTAALRTCSSAVR